MEILVHWITGASIGIEITPDPDYGGHCIVLDIVIMRLIIGFPPKEDDDAV